MRRNRHERGEGNFGCLVGVVLLLVAIFIAFKIIPVKVKAAEVREVLQDESKLAGMHNDDQIRTAILRKAREDQLPITEDNIKITRTAAEITVDLNYVVPIDFPGFTYQMHISNYQKNPIF
jgi:predicted membrane protein